jgi:adenylate cyclase
VARPVLDELLLTEEHDPLAPRHADISVLIADMQDYTRITAYSTLEEAASLTRDFLDCLTRPVLEFRGTLDKYTGDGMVAFWGAPLADPQHAERALDAALAIHAAVARYNEARSKRGDLPVRVRIGLASGRALVGDLGTTFRSTYTAVGDVINLASRLQQAARDLDCDIVASRALADSLSHRRFLPVGAVAVRGLAREEIFTPALDNIAPPPDGFMAAQGKPLTPRADG